MENKKIHESVLLVVPTIDTEGPSAGRDDMWGDWEAVMGAMQELHSTVRSSLKDSFGHPLVISWFLLDWAGYNPNDPEFKRRGHDSALHAVWRKYTTLLLTAKNRSITGDDIYWHYHHPPKDGSWGWNKDWNDSRWYEYVLGKRLLDFRHFPSVYRAGKYVENNETSHWLEKWIPFDMSNISPVRRPFHDWSQATTSSVPYHPDADNYQKKGNMRRLIGRSLPVAAKGGSGALDAVEVEKACVEAYEKGRALFSFHTHDYYKSALNEFRSTHDMIDTYARQVGVRFRYVNALEAFREFVPFRDSHPSVEIQYEAGRATVRAHGELFTDQPFFVVETSRGTIERLDGSIKVKSEWIYHVGESVSRMGAAVTDNSGAIAVDCVQSLLS